MTKDQVWQKLVDKNPSFAEDNGVIQMSPAVVRKLFDLVWREAQWDLASQEKTKDDDIPDVMNNLFRSFGR